MSAHTKFFSIVITILLTITLQPLPAQDKLSWLDDYTGEMLIGSDTYQYSFTNVEGNDCKLNFKEQLTDKKGSTETRSWIFYLSDIDPSAISFKARGKSINVTMEIRQSQKFITYYEEGEIYGYTNEIVISLNEVDMARAFIEAMQEKISNCSETEATWENRDQAIAWLVDNVGKAKDDDIEWDQKFMSGDQGYMVDFQANSVNGKGEEKSFNYIFDLSDINPLAINLKISGKTLLVEVPVKESKRYIQIKSPSGSEFTNEMLIYANGIELSRQIVNTLTYLVNNTTPERPQWDSYNASLGYVKDQLGEVKVGDALISNSLNFVDSPSGLVDFIIENADSDGTSEKETYSFYLADIAEKLKLEVSKSSITVEMETKNRREFIRETADEKIADYSSTLGFQVSDIDLARNIINAFEFAIAHSEEDIKQFREISEVSSWISEHIQSIEIDGEMYDQKIKILEENENQLELENKLTESDGSSTETRFILYPEDISLDKLDIKVSGKKLSVPLSSGTNKYIKNYKNGTLQNFTGSTEILFFDPLAAKNFMAAIRFLKENSTVEDRTAMGKDEAIAFLTGNIQNITLPDDQYDQKIGSEDEGNCKLSFSRIETDSKGGSDQYIYEFSASDINSGNSKLAVKGEIISLNLVTNGNEKLIKPYKNSVADDFVDDFIIYVDDVLLAKKTLAAFAALSKECGK